MDHSAPHQHSRSEDAGPVWEDPPRQSARTYKGVWADRLSPLVDHPKRWARVATRSASSAYATVARLKNRTYVYPPGRWEFISRNVGDGKWAVYARYLGAEDDPQ
jgi:hypothetical protein